MKKVKISLACLYCNQRLLDCLIPEDNDKHRPTFFIEATCPYCVGKSKSLGVYKPEQYKISTLSISPANKRVNIKDCVIKDDVHKYIMEKV